jgi:hypothetical protein
MAVFLDAIAPMVKAQPRGAGIAGQLRLDVPGMYSPTAPRYRPQASVRHRARPGFLPDFASILAHEA